MASPSPRLRGRRSEKARRRLPWAFNIADYASAEFMSRKGIEYGSITLHPDGIPHGPHPGLAEQSIGQTRTNELAVMMDTYRPLTVAKQALAIEDTSYCRSGLERMHGFFNLLAAASLTATGVVDTEESVQVVDDGAAESFVPDYELEAAFFVGRGNRLGEPIPIDLAMESLPCASAGARSRTSIGPCRSSSRTTRATAATSGPVTSSQPVPSQDLPAMRWAV